MFLEKRIALLEDRVARVEAARETFHVEPARHPSIGTILESVCAQYRFTPWIILGSRREAAVVKVRHIAIWITRQTTPLTSTQIGRHFHRDHTSVLYALRAVENLRDTDPAYRAETDLWLKRFEAPAHSEFRVHPCPSAVKPQ